MDKHVSRIVHFVTTKRSDYIQLKYVTPSISLPHKDTTLGQNKIVSLIHLFEAKLIKKKTENEILPNFRRIVYIIQHKSFAGSKTSSTWPILLTSTVEVLPI